LLQLVKNRHEIDEKGSCKAEPSFRKM